MNVVSASGNIVSPPHSMTSNTCHVSADRQAKNKKKCFLSIWLPSFAIDRLREKTRRYVDGHFVSSVPESKPFALVLSGHRGLMITAINACARREGIEVGQTLADARAAIPHLITKPAEPERDHKRLYALAYAAGRYGPARNVEGEDGLWVDITGVTHLFGGSEALAQDCIQRFQKAGYHARTGIAGTPAAAFALARYGPPLPSRGKSIETQNAVETRTNKPTGQNTRPIQQDARLGHCSSSLLVGDQAKLTDLPIEALRLEAKTIVLLKRLGLRRIGQLYNLPRTVLARRFRDLKVKGAGRVGEREGLAQAVLLRLDQALGQQADPHQPLAEPPAFIARRSYPDILITSEGIEAACHDLASELCNALIAYHKGARRLRFSLYRADGSVADAMIGTKQPCCKPDHLLSLFRDKLNTLDAGFGIDMITLEALQVDGLEETQSCLAQGNGDFDSAQVQANTAALIDRLTNRLGQKTVFQLEKIESHIPEHAQKRTFDFITKPNPQQIYVSQRPSFLLIAPEKITVIAEVPEGPPARFTWRRVLHRIIKTEGPERIEPEWWKRLAVFIASTSSNHENSSTRIVGSSSTQTAMHSSHLLEPKNDQDRIRDYYVLEDDCGVRYWVFRSGLYQREMEDGPPNWYMHGLFG